MYFNDEIQKWLCVMKLIDSTINPLNSESSLPAYLTLTAFSRRKPDLPEITHAGNIIRVHRAMVRKHFNSYQINCDTGIKSAWAIFHLSEGINPIMISSQTYTLVPEDKTRLDELRNFSSLFFDKYNMTSLLNFSEKKRTDINCLALVLERKAAGLIEKLRLFDGKIFFKLKIPIRSFASIGAKSIVYIRGMKIEHGRYSCEDFTGILVVPENYATAKKLMKKIRKKLAKNLELRKKFLLYIQIMDESDICKTIVMSKVDNPRMPFIRLKKLFNLSNEKAHNMKFRIKVCPIEIGPTDPSKWLVSTQSTKYILNVYSL